MLQKAKKQKSLTEDSDAGAGAGSATSPKKDDSLSGSQSTGTPSKDRSSGQAKDSKSPGNQDVSMDKSNNNTQLLIDKSASIATSAPQTVYQISGATIAAVAVAGQPSVTVAMSSGVATVTTVPVTITNGTILSVQQGNKEEKPKKKDKSEKKNKTVLQARPIVPAPMTVTSTLAPVTTHATVASGTAGLKPIQPKPTILGEPARTDPGLIQLKESKKSKKKKNKDKDQSPGSSQHKSSSKDAAAVAKQPQEVGSASSAQPQASGGHVRAESTSVIKSATSSPLKAPPPGEGVDLRTTPNKAQQQTLVPKPSDQGSSKKPLDLAGVKPAPPHSQAGGSKHLHPPSTTQHSPSKSHESSRHSARSVLSPLNVSSEGKDHHGGGNTGEARSPAAYSDISDDGTPTLDSPHHGHKHHHSNKGHGDGKQEGGKQAERASGEPHPQSGAPYPGYPSGQGYYGNAPYLVPGSQGGGAPGPREQKDGDPGSVHPRTSGPPSQMGPDGKPPKDSAPGENVSLCAVKLREKCTKFPRNKTRNFTPPLPSNTHLCGKHDLSLPQMIEVYCYTGVGFAGTPSSREGRPSSREPSSGRGPGEDGRPPSDHRPPSSGGGPPQPGRWSASRGGVGRLKGSSDELVLFEFVVLPRWLIEHTTLAEFDVSKLDTAQSRHRDFALLSWRHPILTHIFVSAH